MRPATSEEMLSGLRSFVCNCVDLERQERFFGFLTAKSGIRKWLEQLDHFQNYLDVSKANNLSGIKSGREIIDKFYLPKLDEVFLFSTLIDMRGVILDLDSAIEETFKVGNGSIICSARNSFFYALYFGEEPHAQFLWKPKK